MHESCETWLSFIKNNDAVFSTDSIVAVYNRPYSLRISSNRSRSGRRGVSLVLQPHGRKYHSLVKSYSGWTFTCPSHLLLYALLNAICRQVQMSSASLICVVWNITLFMYLCTNALTHYCFGSRCTYLRTLHQLYGRTVTLCARKNHIVLLLTQCHCTLHTTYKVLWTITTSDSWIIEVIQKTRNRSAPISRQPVGLLPAAVNLTFSRLSAVELVLV